MHPHPRHSSILLCGLLLITGCSTLPHSASLNSEAGEETYKANRGRLGTVLLDINWGRRWGCGGFDHAELRGLGFDRQPSPGRPAEAEADVVFEGPSSLVLRPAFQSYALLLQPGTYALSSVTIKAAKGKEPVVARMTRAQLEQDDAPGGGGKGGKGGSFRVAASETVYIGNFALDCSQEPILWRYFTQGREHFQQHLTEYRRKYPFLKLDDVQYRLFDTKVFGKPYQLP